MAFNGRNVLELAGNLVPELFILDIGLQDIDGYELARSLRLNPALKNRLSSL
jgi:DNA-binding response OmpR family regulator